MINMEEKQIIIVFLINIPQISYSRPDINL